MATWTSNNDPAGTQFIDHITDYRLSREPHYYPAKLKSIWWSVLIELEGRTINQFAEDVARLGYKHDILIPADYDSADRERYPPAQSLVIFARKSLIKQLNKPDNPFHVVSIWLGAITPDQFLNHNADAFPLPEILVDDKTVVQAVIDDGIAIAHDLFRTNKTSSRIHYAKLFGAKLHKKKSTSSYGRDLEKKEIDKLLRKCTFDGLLDEELFYRKTGQLDLANGVFSTVALRRSHGTHVMALAAGHCQTKHYDTRPIICAALPSEIVSNPTGYSLLPVICLAFHNLMKQARRFRTHSGTLAPVVFNFSYGDTIGPHDGTGIYSWLFDYHFGQKAEYRYSEMQKTWLTLPAGNSNLDRLHAVSEVKITDKETAPLDLNVLPDDHTNTLIQIWMPVGTASDHADFATIKVTAPCGEQGVIHTQPGQHIKFKNNAGKVCASLAYQHSTGKTDDTKRGLVTLLINPTASIHKASDLAPAGHWTIEICRDNLISQDPINTYIGLDRTFPGFPLGGRQAYFNNPDYQRFGPFGEPLPVDPPDSTCPVRRSGTINGFACGEAPIVVAAYTEQTSLLSSYSAAGPLNPRALPPALHRDGPDVAAKGDDSQILYGVISAGSRCGSWVRMNGTSVSAPQIARAAAEGILGSPDTGRDWAKNEAKRQPFKLKGDPKTTRAGSGGVKVKTFDHP